VFILSNFHLNSQVFQQYINYLDYYLLYLSIMKCFISFVDLCYMKDDPNCSTSSTSISLEDD